jgi:hypothetical protein
VAAFPVATLRFSLNWLLLVQFVLLVPVSFSTEAALSVFGAIHFQRSPFLQQFHFFGVIKDSFQGHYRNINVTPRRIGSAISGACVRRYIRDAGPPSGFSVSGARKFHQIVFTIYKKQFHLLF